jgi:lipoprotein-anchoring transpeptidase ErfK/SrfK
VLHGDIIHLRRANGRDWDGLLHVNPRPPSLTVTTAQPPPLLVRTGLPTLVLTSRPAVVAVVTTPPPALVLTSAPTVTPLTTNPPALAGGFPRPVQDVLEAQVALVRRRISPGCIDGVMGFQTREALEVFQRQQRLPRTGDLDAATCAALLLDAPALRRYVVTDEELAALQPLASTWSGKATQGALAYETPLELVAERTLASQRLIQRLNPEADWQRVRVGDSFLAPDAAYPAPEGKAAWVRIRLGRRTLQAYDANTNLLAHFPCSIAQRVEKRPVGSLRVVVLAPDPDYTFRPALFPESAEARAMDPARYLILKPGPNNPVGLAWIGLDKPGYGIHGTPVPEQVGRTESHGCFRLSNWNAQYLVRLVVPGTPVLVEP